jgi:hypothetical protein
VYCREGKKNVLKQMQVNYKEAVEKGAGGTLQAQQNRIPILPR